MASAHQKIDDHERRKARARIERSDEGYEITLSSELDDSFLHFVSRAPAKRSTPKGSTPAAAPEEPDKEVDEKEARLPKREHKPKEA